MHSPAHHKLPAVAQAFIRGLLEREPERRLGSSRRSGATHLNAKVKEKEKGKVL